MSAPGYVGPGQRLYCRPRGIPFPPYTASYFMTCGWWVFEEGKFLILCYSVAGQGVRRAARAGAGIILPTSRSGWVEVWGNRGSLDDFLRLDIAACRAGDVTNRHRCKEGAPWSCWWFATRGSQSSLLCGNLQRWLDTQSGFLFFVITEGVGVVFCQHF